jgi:heme-degrading monooxygenase HmoA
MVTIIWEYLVAPGMQPAFEQHYHAQGTWAICFRRHPEFIETRLIKDRTNSHRYLTLDYWQNEASFEQFHQQYHAEYDAIDAKCSALTISETYLGTFTEPILEHS